MADEKSKILVFSTKTGDYEPLTEMKPLPDGRVLYRSDSENNSTTEVK